MRSLLVIWLAAACLAGCQPDGGAGSKLGGKAFNSADLTGSNIKSTLALTDHMGKPRQLSDFAGHVVIVFFGYTQCPDVCPTNMNTLRQVVDQLGEDAKRLQVIFVTLDPARDTQELLAQYVPNFHPSFIGLYGSKERTAAVASEFHVFYREQAGATAGTYTIDHSAGSYVFDPQGRLRLYLKHGDAPERIAADIRRLLQGE